MGMATKITAITCTYQRPDAFALCEQYLKRQTRQPDQWLVLDGPERMQKKFLAAIEEGKIEHESVVVIEDDDFYRADWIEWAVGQLEKGYDLVGEGNAAYYNVANRWWSECGNVRHAALCATAMHRDMLEQVANIIHGYDWPFFDTRIWPLECNKKLQLPKRPEERRVIGIKGIRSETGMAGYSGEHHDVNPQGTHADPALLQLWRWIGEDAMNYQRFWRLAPKLHA